MTENLFTRTDDDDTDLRALATIDPAGPRDPQAHRSAEAQKMLASITSAPPAGVENEDHPSRSRRWPWLVAAAAVAAGVIVIAPTVGSSGGAFASWTDVPAAATARDADAAEDYCRDMWLSATEDPGEGVPDPSVIENADLVLAEQRGDYTYTILSDGDWGMDCLVGTHTGGFWSGTGGSAAGSLGQLGLNGDPAPDAIVDLTMAAMGTSGDDSLVLMLYARVGADVSAAVVHTPGAGDVEATVTNGYLAAWAPGLPDDVFDRPTIGITLYLIDGSEVELTPQQVQDLTEANAG